MSSRPRRQESIVKACSSFAEDLPVNEMAPRQAIDASSNCRADSRRQGTRASEHE
jgi:hypothetical protein